MFRSRHAYRLESTPRREACGDAALLTALLAGDRTAGRQIWERYLPLVKGLLQGVFGPTEDVEDAAQEVFVRLLRSAQRIDDGALLRSYIVTLAMNVSRAELRRRRVRRLFTRALGGPGAPRPPGFVPGPAGDPRMLAAVGRLYQVLDRMPTEDRLLFTMRYVHELELSEIAQASGRSLATVKRRLARAAGRLAARVRHDALLADYLRDERAREELEP